MSGDAGSYANPNYVNPPGDGYTIFPISLMWAISTVVVLGRLGVRVTKRAGVFGVDDVRRTYSVFSPTQPLADTLGCCSVD